MVDFARQTDVTQKRERAQPCKQEPELYQGQAET